MSSPTPLPSSPAPSAGRKPFWMIIAVLVAAGAIWSVFWFMAAQTMEQEITAQKDQVQDTGWRATWSGFHVGGYPFQLRAHFTDIEAVETSHAITCRVPSALVIAQPWNTQHFLTSWTGSAVCHAPDVDASLSLPQGIASIVLSSDHEIPDVTIDASDVVLTIQGTETTVEKSIISLRPSTANNSDPDRILVDLAANLSKVSSSVLSEAALNSYERVSFGLTLSAPQEVLAATDSLQNTHVTLRTLLLDDGTSTLEATGEVDISSAGNINGELNVIGRQFTAYKDMVANSPNRQIANMDNILAIIQAVFTDAREPEEDMVRIEVDIEDSVIGIGNFNLMRLPPVP